MPTLPNTSIARASSLIRILTTVLLGVVLTPLASRADPVVAEAKPFGHIERKDPRLDRLIPPDAQVERLVNGITWSEGPVWVSDGGYLLFSEIPRNTIHRWKQGEGL